MAKTTGDMVFVEATVRIGTDSACSTDLSGVGTAVAVSGGSRPAGEAHVFAGDTPVIGAGKRAGLDIQVRYVYSEEAAEAFEIARAIYETAGAACFIEYAPGGDTPDTNFMFKSAQSGVAAAGIMTEFGYPGGEAQGGEIIPGEFTIHVAEILKTTVAAG